MTVLMFNARDAIFLASDSSSSMWIPSSLAVKRVMLKFKSIFIRYRSLLATSAPITRVRANKIPLVANWIIKSSTSIDVHPVYSQNLLTSLEFKMLLLIYEEFDHNKIIPPWSLLSVLLCKYNQDSICRNIFEQHRDAYLEHALLLFPHYLSWLLIKWLYIYIYINGIISEKRQSKNTYFK